MILSCCIIVGSDKELENLKRCINSVYPFVDEIIVTANGAETKEIEKTLKDREKIKYFYHAWTKDFAEQRNFCASKIRKDADYYVWIDADDVLVGGELLRDIAIKAKKMNLQAVFFDYWYACSFDGEPALENIKKIDLVQARERLLKPGSVVWKKRIHETPVPLENIDYRHTIVKHSKETPIVWLHLGVTFDLPMEEQIKKTNRNRELLELELEDERKGEGADPRTLLYLMKIYTELGGDELLLKNLEMGNEYLLKSGWDAERATCCALMARSLEKLNRSQEAKELLFKSIKEYPYDPILYLYLSRVCLNLNQYKEMKHWLEMGLKIDSSESSANMTNLLEMKVLATELLMNYYFKAERNVRKAYQAMQMLYKEVPNQDNQERLGYLKDLNDLDVASENAHKLTLFYESLNNSEGIVDVVKSMPKAMQDLPFAWHMYNKHKEPRKWHEDEICYYASFGQPHFEKWSAKSLEKGIGGSETAVIRLAKEWVEKGFKVVVYCDCGDQEGVYDGVIYLPYFKFNPKDHFNIFINWRSTHLAGKIKCKKFVCDFHDLYAEESVKNYDRYDKIFVKTNYHRSLAPSVPDEKFEVVWNGI
jgi:tetratricopeptide (TPR) repeat protein